ncbi:MAG TPA: hypothetical protein GX723_08945 [Thermoanaerobacterales bacterium]|jgi:hypothetical protein|nr:hypothetical protein [Thermoanaerobacterales bacterium]
MFKIKTVTLLLILLIASCEKLEFTDEKQEDIELEKEDESEDRKNIIDWEDDIDTTIINIAPDASSIQIYRDEEVLI